MQPADSMPFITLIEGVYSFYGKASSTFAADVWWQALKPYDLDAIRDALGRHCVNPDNGQFLPRPADVVRMLEGSTLDSAVTAWTKVDHAVRHVGTYATVAFDDPLIHRCIADMGGWPQLGQKQVDEWPFVAKEFQTRYRGYKSRREIGAYPPVLIGIFDQQNRQQGHADQVPVMIGAPERVREVVRLGTNRPMLQITQHADALALPARKDEAAA